MIRLVSLVGPLLQEGRKSNALLAKIADKIYEYFKDPGSWGGERNYTNCYNYIQAIIDDEPEDILEDLRDSIIPIDEVELSDILVRSDFAPDIQNLKQQIERTSGSQKKAYEDLLEFLEAALSGGRNLTVPVSIEMFHPLERTRGSALHYSLTNYEIVVTPIGLASTEMMKDALTFKSILIHELQHIYDSYRSMWKALSTTNDGIPHSKLKSTHKAIRSLSVAPSSKYYDGLSKVLDYLKYRSDRYEVWASIQEWFYKILDQEYSSVRKHERDPEVELLRVFYTDSDYVRRYMADKFVEKVLDYFSYFSHFNTQRLEDIPQTEFKRYIYKIFYQMLSDHIENITVNRPDLKDEVKKLKKGHLNY